MQGSMNNRRSPADALTLSSPRNPATSVRGEHVGGLSWSGVHVHGLPHRAWSLAAAVRPVAACRAIQKWTFAGLAEPPGTVPKEGGCGTPTEFYLASGSGATLPLGSQGKGGRTSGGRSSTAGDICLVTFSWSRTSFTALSTAPYSTETTRAGCFAAS